MGDWPACPGRLDGPIRSDTSHGAMADADQTSCPACGASVDRPLVAVADHQYVECVVCSSGRLDPLPAADPVELYDQSYFQGASNGGYLDYDADAALHRRNAHARLDRRATATSPGPQRLIDVGCAIGYVLDEAVARGWSAIGVDASAHAHDNVTRRGHSACPDLTTAIVAGPVPTIITFFRCSSTCAIPAPR